METSEKPTAWLIHGFNVRDGGNRTVGRMFPFFRDAGFVVKVIRYGWTTLLLRPVRAENPKVAAKLVKLTKPGDVVVGHSNGCSIAHRASHEGALFSGAVYINPALPTDATPGINVDWCHVWHNYNDTPTRCGRCLRKWSPLNITGIEKHPWGAMGAYGYRLIDRPGLRDPRMVNFDKSDKGAFPLACFGHSDVFRNPQLREFFGPLIAQKAKDACSFFAQGTLFDGKVTR